MKLVIFDLFNATVITELDCGKENRIQESQPLNIVRYVEKEFLFKRRK
jgi:hypothetical protein